jgi:hypothetical protein
MSNLDLLRDAAPQFFETHEANKRALAALDGVLLGNGHVIMVGDLAIKPTMERVGDGWRLIDATPCKLTDAPQYSQESAESIAGQLANGNDTKGRAVHIREALGDAIAATDAIIKKLAEN